MRLHSLWVLRLAEDLKKVIIGQEVEPGEDLALCLKVHVKGLLDLFQLAIHVIELLQGTWKHAEPYIRLFHKSVTFSECTQEKTPPECVGESRHFLMNLLHKTAFWGKKSIQIETFYSQFTMYIPS